MYKTKIKDLLRACHRLVTNNPDRYESWEWENKFIDAIYLAIEDARLADLKKFFFLSGLSDYLRGKCDAYLVIIDRNEDYRNGLQVASELCEEIKYFGVAFGKDSYELTD